MQTGIKGCRRHIHLSFASVWHKIGMLVFPYLKADLMNKSLWMLLLLCALLTALTEMTRPQKPVLNAAGKKTPTKDKPAGRLHLAYKQQGI
jgi:hypothetical protein